MSNINLETRFMEDLLDGLDETVFALPLSQPSPRRRVPSAPASHISPRRIVKAEPAFINSGIPPHAAGIKTEQDGMDLDSLFEGLSQLPPLTPPSQRRTSDLCTPRASQKRAKTERDMTPISSAVPSSTNRPPLTSPTAEEAQRSRAYTRCCVVAVLDRQIQLHGGRTAPEKALLLRVVARDRHFSASCDRDAVQPPAEILLALLHDEWNQTLVRRNDIVHLIGIFDNTEHPIPRGLEHTTGPRNGRSPSQMQLAIDTSLPVVKQEPGTEIGEDLWDDMGSLPSLSQCGSQDSSLDSTVPTCVKTMIFGSRSPAADTEKVEGEDADPRDNLLIVHPDILVPATKVADVASCIRKPVIQDRLRGSSDINAALVMGTMLHEVLQACLTGSDQSANTSGFGLPCLAVKSEFDDTASAWPEFWDGVGDFSSVFVERQIKAQVYANMESLFAIDMDIEEATAALREKAAPFARFANVYLDRHDGTFHPEAALLGARAAFGNGDKSYPKTRITRVLDVEEEIWSPMYGLKGKVDASVECEILEMSPAASHTAFLRACAADEATESNVHKSVVPLELKTGRARMVSTEHRAQTMLYTLMMSDRYGTKVGDGLLYYSKSGGLHRISRSRNEVRSLVIGRNELAHYLRHDLKRVEEHGTSESADRLLPPTIDNEHNCRRCYAVDGCMLYRSAVEKVTEPPTNPLETQNVKLEPQNLKKEDEDPKTEARPKILEKSEIKIEAPNVKLESGSPAVEAPVPDIEGNFVPPPPSRRSAIANIFDEKTGHLTSTHRAFFRKWERLLSMEEEDAMLIRREMWNMDAEDREQLGRCFANMRLDFGVDDSTGNYGGGETPDVGAMLPVNAPLTKGMHKVTRRFVRHAGTTEGDKAKELSGHMSINDPVTVSIEPSTLSVAQGFITKITPTMIEVGLDHDLHASLQRVWGERGISPSSQAINDIVFRIDKDELSSGLGRVRANLANLFLSEARGGDTKRCELVVDLRPPRFMTLQQTRDAFPTGNSDTSILDQISAEDSLNVDQKLAIEKVLSTKDYALILGMPGTGKTSTIAKLIQILTRMGKRILLTSYTHSAVDTILRKLANDPFDDTHILRLGNKDKVHPDARRYMLPPCSTLEELRDAFVQPKVVAATCLSVHHPFFTSMLNKSRKAAEGKVPTALFDYCIVDEASQIPLPTCLGPLRFADKFVLVGDHYQLPPLVKNARAKKGGLDVSLFKLLSDKYEHEAMVYLQSQYRMNSDIMHLSNTLVYHGFLKAGNEEIGRQVLKLDNVDRALAQLAPLALSSTQDNDNCTLQQDWIRTALDPQNAVRFFDTSKLPLELVSETQHGEIIKNNFEARAVVHLASALVLAGCRPEDIAVVTPYRQQLKLLQSLLHKSEERATQSGQRSAGLEKIELLTADQSQGRDKDVVIVAFTRASVGTIAANMGVAPEGTNSATGELLNDLRRLNVTLTRARRKLLLIGHGNTLHSSSILKSLLDLLREKRWIYALQQEIQPEREAGTSLSANQHRNAIDATRQSKTLHPMFQPGASSRTVLQSVQPQKQANGIKARRLH